MSLAQNSQSYLNDVGSPAYSVQIPVENGFIDVSNGNLHLEFPLASPPQRGALSVSERLVYDSRIWMFSPFGTHGSYHWWPYNVPGTSTTSGGWRMIQSNEVGSIGYSNVYENDTDCGEYRDDGTSLGLMDYYTRSNIVWTDPSGTVHNFNATQISETNDCSGSSNYYDSVSGGFATDGSGYSIANDPNGNVRVIDGNGTQVYPNIIDRFGNLLSSDGNGNLVDDTGRIPVIATTNGNVTYYDVLAPNGPVNNNGTRVRYTVTSASVPVSTTFQPFSQSDIYPWNPSNNYLTPVQSIALPDGSQYSFTYDTNGEVSSVTLPTGGVVRYGYTDFVDSANTENNWLTSRTKGTDPAMTVSPSVVTTCANYSTGCVEQDLVHQPSGDETAYQLTLNNGAWNTGASTYTGSAANGQLLSQVTSYNTYTNGCTSMTNCSGANYLSQTLQTNVVYGNPALSQSSSLYSQTLSTFDPTSGKPTSTKQWDYAAYNSGVSTTSSRGGTPDREVDYTYTGYDPYQVTALAGGAQAGLTTYSYTNSAVATSNLPSHGTQNAGGPYLQSVAHWLNTNPSNPPTTSYQMDDSGMVTAMTDPNNNPPSHISYQCANSLPYQSSNALGQTTQSTYDCASGALLGVQDPNDLAAQRSGTTYAYEGAAARIQTVTLADGGTTSYSYPSAAEVDVAVAANPDPTITSSSVADSYGRPYKNIAGGFETDTTYDVNGRVNCVTLPYAPGGSPSGSTCVTAYDGLSRPLTQRQPDGTSAKTWLYGGQWTQATNELGYSWIRASNAFGSLTAVYEPGIAGATSYQYDGLGNLTYIQQPGNPGEKARGLRSFIYDSLSRLVCVSQPESATGNCPPAPASPPAGVLSYVYNPAGNVSQRTDPLGFSTNYHYDALNRLTEKDYSDGSPNVLYNYDENGDWGYQGCNGPAPFTQCNTIGRLSSTYVANGYLTGNTFGYDAVGRLHMKGSCTGSSQCGHDANTQWYFYDLAGNQENQDFGNDGNSGVYFGGQWMTYDNAGRLSTQGFFAVPLPAPITPEFTANQYGPGGLVQSTLGNQLLSETRSYDPSLRSSGYSVGTSSVPALYSWGVGFQGNGNLSYSNDSVNGNWTYKNDALNRLSAASSAAISLQWSYDSFGNRWSQAAQGGVSFNYLTYGQTGTNRPDQLLTSMDQAGQLSVDGSATPAQLTYDHEGRLASAGSESYLYNGVGERVAKFVNGTPFTGTLASVYLYDSGERVVTELDQNYNVRRKEAYAGGLHVASYDASGNVVYTATDWLGTIRANFDTNGNPCQTFTNQPFGDNRVQQGGCGVSPVFFTGLEHDAESNLDHTPNRQYSYATGRWITPDPYNGSIDLSNPQTLNRYAYVEDMPMTLVDPSGLQAGTINGDPVHGSSCTGECSLLAGLLTLGVDAAVQGIRELFYHPKFHGSTALRPDGDNFYYSSDVLGTDTYTMYVYKSEYVPQLVPRLQFASLVAPNNAPSNNPCPAGTTPHTQRMLVTGYDNSYQSTQKNPGDPHYGQTTSGAMAGPGTIAAPRTYSFGTQMFIPGYGLGTVLDRGGAIRNSHIDLWFRSTQQAINWGAQHLQVTVCR